MVPGPLKNKESLEERGVKFTLLVREVYFSVIVIVGKNC